HAGLPSFEQRHEEVAHGLVLWEAGPVGRADVAAGEHTEHALAFQNQQVADPLTLHPRPRGAGRFVRADGDDIGRHDLLYTHGLLLVCFWGLEPGHALAQPCSSSYPPAV